MRRNMLTGLAAFVCIGCAGSPPAQSAKSTGVTQARADIARGVLNLRTYGLNSAGADVDETALRNKLGIGEQSVGGCAVTGDIVAESDAYNEVMWAEIRRRFGDEVLRRLQHATQAAK